MYILISKNVATIKFYGNIQGSEKIKVVQKNTVFIQ